MSADNRILQDQLQMKISENDNLQDTIKSLKEQLNHFMDKINENSYCICKNKMVIPSFEDEPEGISLLVESSSLELNSISTNKEFKESCSEQSLRSQVLKQAAEIENLKQKSLQLAEEKDGLQIHCQELTEEASYARELAGAAAVELRNLAEEVTKLSSENAKLTDDLTASLESTTTGINNFQGQVLFDGKDANDYLWRSDESVLVDELRKELLRKCERESSLETALSVRDQMVFKLQKTVDKSKQCKQDLENKLASMCLFAAKLKKSGVISDESFFDGFGEQEFHPLRKISLVTNGDSVRLKGEILSNYLHDDQVASFEDLRSALEHERRRCKELEGIISTLKAEDISGVDIKALEEMQNFHVEALSKICQEKLICQTAASRR